MTKIFVIDKIKTRDEIIFDFFDSIEVFKEYNINLKNENIINGVMDYNDFENYFKEISMSISDDKIFDYVIHFCWEDTVCNDKSFFYMIDVYPSAVMRHHAAGIGMYLPQTLGCRTAI